MEQIRHIDFHPVTVADKPLFDSYIGRDIMNCDLNFANILCWSDTYHSEVAEVEGSLVIRFEIDGQKSYMQPIGESCRGLVVERLREDAFLQRTPLRIYGLSREWCDFLEGAYPSEFALYSPRSLNDYIYHTAALAQLRGAKYQPKRNHINRFVARYDWRVEPLSGANVDDCLALSEMWLRGRIADEGEMAEQRAIRRAFENMEHLGLRGLVLYADGRPVAFTYGTPINERIFCTHIEKYDAAVEGAATMINREFARTLVDEFEFINREDDLGREGLRFAKMSYHPAILLEKVTALHLTAEQRDMRLLWHAVFGDDYAEIDAFFVRHDDSIPIIYKEGGKVISMLHIVPLQQWGKRVAYIYAVATEEEYRNRGVASKLLAEALDHIRRSGDYDIAALIPSSIASKRLYERLGFEDRELQITFPDDDYLGTGSTPHDLAMIQTISH